MNVPFLRRRVLQAASAAPLLAPRWLAAAEPAGSVQDLRGEATAEAGSQNRKLARDAAVFVGDTVVTAEQSAVALKLGQATLIRLGPDTRLRIDRFLLKIGGVLELAKGAMMFEHDAAAGQENTAVRSPFGLLAVRGTRYFAGPSNNVFGVFVYSGEVLVVGRNVGVTVLPGMGTDIPKPGDEPTTPHHWSAERVKEAERRLLV